MEVPVTVRVGSDAFTSVVWCTGFTPHTILVGNVHFTGFNSLKTRCNIVDEYQLCCL